MLARALYLLSPYQVPAQHSLMLGNEDVLAFLNGHAALWHPAALLGSAGLPSVASPYDHEMPSEGALYALPDSPPVSLPDDWEDRVRQAGAISFQATADRAATLAGLLEALRARNGEANPALFDLTPEQVAPFFGLGFGFLHLTALFEAMEHDNVLAAHDLHQEVIQAVTALARGDADGCQQALQAAAQRMLAAREVAYPVTMYVLDMGVLDGSPDARVLPGVDRDLPANLIASSQALQKLAGEQPERLAAIRQRASADRLDVLGGCYMERADALLPLESQLWNLLHGLRVARDALGTDVRIFARRELYAHPQLPLLLQSVGLPRALLLRSEDTTAPEYHATVVSWPAPDGKQVDVFARTPYEAGNPQTGFHVAHYLHKTIMQDQAATLALVHRGTPAGPWYDDWQELSRLAPVLGQWTGLFTYFDEVMSGEQASPASADDFQIDSLSAREQSAGGAAVSGMARHHRLRRRVDTVWTLLAFCRGLNGSTDLVELEGRLRAAENEFEKGRHDLPELHLVQRQAAEAMTARLQARAAPNRPGTMILNPCSFARRVALEIPGPSIPVPLDGPVKACQVDSDQTRLVVEVPALGFAWIPRSGPPGTPPPASRMRLADARHVRNEFFEAEIDPATGGLRGLWDHRTRANRLGQQLVFNPGSTMRASAVRVTSAGPALGEVVSEGTITDEQGVPLASFRQRFRAWLGRPLLELRIDIHPERPPEGYPWHNYYGARFAWRDERSLLLRGVNGTSYVSSSNRPETPDYLEVRNGPQATTIFPGGLPFHQRSGARMVDVVLVPPGETGYSFELAIGLDRDYPMQTALGLVTPVISVPTSKGPPHVGPSGWLFHLDAPNLLLTSVRPAADGEDAVIARLLECGLYAGQAALRCLRNPREALLVDARGERVQSATVEDDAAVFDVTQGELIHLKIAFGDQREKAEAE